MVYILIFLPAQQYPGNKFVLIGSYVFYVR